MRYRPRGSQLGPVVASALLLVPLAGCGPRRGDAPETTAPAGLAGATSQILIEPAPEHLRGRVALPAGARIYARPTFASSSWALVLPDPPLAGGNELPRVKAFRVVGVVRSGDGLAGGAGDFVAITNDLAGEDAEAVGGCGPALDDLGHLRLLVYVPVVHLAEVTTEVVEVDGIATAGAVERLQLGAGTRVGPAQLGAAGLPEPPAGSSWRTIDADGIRTLAPIPDAAVGRAWDPARLPEFDRAGEALFRDAEGSTLWLRDDGGAELELTIRNACGQLRQAVRDPAQVESLRALALDAFYDQRPTGEPAPAVEIDADYRIAAGTPLRWPDGELAGQTLADWSVAIGVGQTWDGRRCFPLVLGPELAQVGAPALGCVDPDALELLAAAGGFGVSDELALGGSIELGPAIEIEGGPWDPQALRWLLNGRHDSVGECLRPLLQASEGLVGARWDLRLTIGPGGQVDEVEVVARGPSVDAVEDCLRAEAFTWLVPDDGAGVLEVPVTVGDWSPAPEPTPEPEPDPEPSPPDEGRTREPEPEDRPAGERGKVIIIRDEQPEPEQAP